MCTEIQLRNIVTQVASQAKAVFADKLHAVILFGSYVRGDYDEESDIDIMILADIDDSDTNTYTRQLYDTLYEFELEHDCVLSLCVVPEDRFNRFKGILPFYRNVDREGVRIAV